jgi:hypothetical protein
MCEGRAALLDAIPTRPRDDFLSRFQVGRQ